MAADALYDAGQYKAAAAAFTRLANRPMDKPNTALRAKLRLSRTLIQLDQHGLAEDLAQQVRRRASDPRLRAQAEYLAALARYDEGTDEAEAAYDRAEKIAATGDYASAEAAFSDLLNRPCPVREDFSQRVTLRLVNLAINRDDLDTARARLASVGPLKTAALEGRSRELEGRIVQRGLDLAIVQASAAADAKAAAGDVQGALAAREAALAANPGASPEVRNRIVLEIAEDLGRLNRFEEAYDRVRPLQAGGLSPQESERAATMLRRIYARQLNFLAGQRLAVGDTLRDQGKPKQALAAYDGVADPSGAWPEEARQRAKLRRASLLRDYNDYRGARAAIAQVSSSPASDDLAASAQRALASLNAETPLNAFHGIVEAGVRYDDNAPAETAALRGEEDFLPLPTNAGLEDESAFLDLEVEYRRRLSDRYDYFRILGDVEATRQASLDQLDRFSGEVRAGPVLQTGPLGSTASFGLVGVLTNRGGQRLHDGVGGYAEYATRLGSWRLAGEYDAVKRDDVRDDYDGWRHSIEIAAQRLRSGFGPRIELELGRDDYSAARTRAWSYGIGGRYRWSLGGDDRVSYGLEASASVRRIRFDAARVLTDGSVGRRTDDRLRFGLALDVTLRGATTIRLDYSTLDIDTNAWAGGSNNRVGISVRRRF